MRRPARLLVLVAAALLLVLIIGRAASVLFTEILWFSDLQQLDVFWARIETIAVVRIATAIVGAAVVWVNLWRVARHLGPVHLRRRYGNLEIAEQVPRRYVNTGMATAAIFAGWWLSELMFPGSAASELRAWMHAQPWGMTDPVFERDIGFYVFALPVYIRLLDFLLLVSLWTLLLTTVGYVLVGAVRVRDNRLEIDETPRLHFAVVVAGVVLLLGTRFWLGRYGVLLDGSGFAGIVGYTDLHARLPAQRVLAVLSLAVAGALIYGAWRRQWWPPLAAVGVLAVASVALGYIYPSIVQQLQVEPNQLARESPYIRRNLEFTRVGFNLDDIDERLFPYEPGPAPAWDELGGSLDRLPLWDVEFLRTAITQTQTRLGYYHFPGVRLDRYGPAGREEPVAIAVREFTREGLPPASRTWRTLHLNARQVRGVGAVVTPVAQKTSRGDPVLWLREIEPVQRSAAAPASLELERSSIFFGESTTDYVIVGSDVENSELAPEAGVPLTSFLRTIAFAWRFGERNLLFATELNESSRLLFRRRIGERLAAVAPFVTWDPDPLPVVVEGRIVWLVDGYSTTAMFPLGTEQPLGEGPGVRYVRNSVKATVDAVSGAVALYALDDDEPMLRAYRAAFPELIRPLDELPVGLRPHLRYPATLARLRAHILEMYHIEDPGMFFSGEDAWQVPSEGGGPGTPTNVRPVELVAPAPGETRADFWISVPFIARERQNMPAVLLVRHGIERYGETVLVEFPRDAFVPGPTQVRTIVEQDPGISQQLSLWREGGSDVDLGRIRVVPLDSTVLYVQPLFLSASQGSIPQLSRVIVSDGTAVYMAETLSTAVDGLGEGTVRPERPIVEVGEAGGWAGEALQLLEEARMRLRDGDFAGFGDALERLERTLRGARTAPPGG